MMSNRGLLAGVLFLCLAAIAIAGCGGGSDETASGESETLSKAQWVKQADAICAKANSRQEAVLRKEAQEAGGAPTKSEQEDFVHNAGVPPLREAAASLGELGAPAGAEEKAEAFIDALEKATDEIEAEPLEFIEAKSQAFTPVERQAEQLGLKVCGTP